MVKIIPYYRVFRTVKKKVNFVFYLIGPTGWAKSIFSRDLIVSTLLKNVMINL